MQLSIITINFNNNIGLNKTINSVVEQSCGDFEFIIIDGKSTDESMVTVMTYKSYIDFWLCENDAGIYDALNKGILRSKGEYLIFLNSGDVFCDNVVLKKCIEILSTSKEVDIYYGDIILSSNEKIIGQKTFPCTLSPFFFYKQTLNHQAAFFNRSLFTKIGLYPTEFKLAADYWFFLNAYMRNCKFQHIPFPIVTYDVGGISSRKQEDYRAEMAKVWKNIVPSGFTDLMNDYIEQRNSLRYSIIKYAVSLNKVFQKIKRRRFNG